MQERYHGIRDSIFQRSSENQTHVAVEPALAGIRRGVVILSFIPPIVELTLLSDYARMTGDRN